MLTSGGVQRDLDKGGRLWQARGLVKALLSALFWLYLAVSLMVFWFAVVPVWLVLLPFDRRRRFSHRYAWVWANHYVALSPYWRIHVEGSGAQIEGGTKGPGAARQLVARLLPLLAAAGS